MFLQSTHTLELALHLEQKVIKLKQDALCLMNVALAGMACGQILSLFEYTFSYPESQESKDQLQKQIEQIKGRTAKQLDKIDRRAIATYTTISEVRSQIHKIENTLENNNISLEQPERPGWIFPGDIVELYAPEDDDLFHTDEETSSQLLSQKLP